MPVWNGQTLTFVQDRPSDKVWTYNRSNVVMPDDGAPFRYSFSALKDRHNAVEVNWIDPNNGWETATELVEDTQAIARYGRNVTKMDAFGCTSRGQAHRAGLWLIKTELLETQTVDFSVGVAYSRVSTFSGDYLRVTDNKGKTHDVLTGSDDGRHSNTSLAWGAGVQFNPTESVAIDVAYEGSGSGDWRTDGFIVGVGYKF
ncbi:TPA: Ail/Lom family outer membrane beta-barrel protein [Escherichia coli]